MARIVFKEEQKVNPVVGDELHIRGAQWIGEHEREAKPTHTWTSNVMLLFCRWLVETADGAEALKHINNMPRQLWLDFGSAPPWSIEREGTDGDTG